MESEFKPRVDIGALHSTKVKKTQQSPDYFGTIAINLSDKTSFETVDGLTIVKLSGWKRVSPTSGKTYLHLSVNRWVPDGTQAQTSKEDSTEENDEVPF